MHIYYAINRHPLHYSKLAESATWSNSRSSVDIMTISLIAFDSTTTHDTMFCVSTRFHCWALFSSKKNYVKNADCGEESAENPMPSQSAPTSV